MKKSHQIAHMKTAFTYAELSSAKKKKVGCIVVKENRIISIGYNGTPPGWDNCCEVEIPEHIDPDSREIIPAYLMTKPEVYHAEANAVAKLARSHESGEGASVFITLEPCIDCAKLLAQVGVKEVFYAEKYTANVSIHKGMTGLEFLDRCPDITVQQLLVND